MVHLYFLNGLYSVVLALESLHAPVYKNLPDLQVCLPYNAKLYQLESVDH